MTSRCQGLFPPHPFFKGKALETRLWISVNLNEFLFSVNEGQKVQLIAKRVNFHPNSTPLPPPTFLTVPWDCDTQSFDRERLGRCPLSAIGFRLFSAGYRRSWIRDLARFSVGNMSFNESKRSHPSVEEGCTIARKKTKRKDSVHKFPCSLYVKFW